MPERRKVAIACQGGGSHAAFGAGVLRRLLAPDLWPRFELVGLSGTSGGAMCAALAWAGLIGGGPDEAVARLTAFWNAVKASEPSDALLNLWGVVAARAPLAAEISPYLYRPLVEQRLRELVDEHVGLARLTPEQRSRSPVALMVGATDVLSGERCVFGGQALTTAHLVASAAIPPLYRSIEIDGRHYWDGLFTSNPPVREFTDPSMCAHKPDEIWVIQINPQRQASVPQAIGDIADRRNELGGNLALAQELYFIEKVNQIAARMSAAAVPSSYSHIGIRVIEMPFGDLDLASKLDRDPVHIDRLITAGVELGGRFLQDAEWPQSGSLPRANRCIP
ncbi:patatin-like phospholipase family protein [Piscinibacter koreensis]|uniref:Patatin-like phospholipase family protein n=1 Tax=Piscinibacter koreensis TaxID=2742824 RepID=A0A7Y6NMP0_9BURK|nr:patatin-like phospholipase family protein [Schlegelella koreensis]